RQGEGPRSRRRRGRALAGGYRREDEGSSGKSTVDSRQSTVGKGTMERTLTIIKPDAVAAGKAGAILAHLEKEGFRVAGMRKLRLSVEQVRAFYAADRERALYEGAA